MLLQSKTLMLAGALLLCTLLTGCKASSPAKQAPTTPVPTAVATPSPDTDIGDSLYPGYPAIALHEDLSAAGPALTILVTRTGKTEKDSLSELGSHYPAEIGIYLNGTTVPIQTISEAVSESVIWGGIFFLDVNGDGYRDIVFHYNAFGTQMAAMSHCYLYSESDGRFTDAIELPANAVFDVSNGILRSSVREGAAMYVFAAYRFENGAPVLFRQLQLTYDPETEKPVFTESVLIDGVFVETVFIDALPEKSESFWDESNYDIVIFWQ